MTQSKERVMGEEGLYRSSFEHDNCGIGAVVNIKGEKSHATVENALKIVENLEHRAGKDAEGKTGDGVGILLQISHKFFSKACLTLGFSLGGEREYGVGVFFFPQNELKRNQAKKMFEIIVEKEGLELLGWRTVPTVPEVLGHKARECMPYIMQAFIKKTGGCGKGNRFRPPSVRRTPCFRTEQRQHLRAISFQPYHRIQRYVPRRTAPHLLPRSAGCRL